MHVAELDAPTVELYVPAPHATHAVADVEPVLVSYVPAPHERHDVCPFVG
jgi:hypothetical protein